MRISGDLKNGGVRAVLRLLGKGGSSGVLRLRAPKSGGSLRIVEGRVVQASLDTVPKLGDALVAKGVVGAEELDGALSLQSRSRRRRPIGQVLVDLGLVERGDVGIALEDQVRAVVAELLAWRAGSYAFEPAREEDGENDDAGFFGLEIEELLRTRKVGR